MPKEVQTLSVYYGSEPTYEASFTIVFPDKEHLNRFIQHVNSLMTDDYCIKPQDYKDYKQYGGRLLSCNKDYKQYLK